MLQQIELVEIKPNRRTIICLTCITLCICSICFYAFGTGVYRTYQQARYEPFIFRPASLMPTELNAEPDECLEREKLAFKKGQAVERLRKVWAD